MRSDSGSASPRKRPSAAQNPREKAERAGPRERYLSKGLRIVHEDDDVLVIDKPAGLLSATPAGEQHDSVFEQVKNHVKMARVERGVRAWIIHRLDRETSGLLVFAKSHRAYEMLKAELQARRVHRAYAAVVEGTFEAHEAKGTIESFLYEDMRGTIHTAESPKDIPKHLKRGESDEEMTAAKPAVTHYRVRAQSRKRALLDIKLETGRKHQIRVHLAHLGHPVVGDRRYDHKADPESRVCLHACELGFTHPASGREVRFESPIPPLFYKAAGVKAGEASAFEEAAAKPEPSPAALASSWNHVASWYDELLEDRVSDHHEQVILPGTQRLLGQIKGSRILDVACGQGILCRRLAAAGAEVVGVDAAPKLVERASHLGPGTYVAGDARKLDTLKLGVFDAASCVMAIMNIEPISSVFRGVAASLRPGGRFVMVLLHPAFRSPGQTAWGWEESKGPKAAAKQYRRVEGYLSPGSREIVMNPGAVSSGKEPVVTMTYHRPIQAYVTAMGTAGLAVDALEEWASVRTSQPGPRAAEENRARREIPMFLAIRGVKK